MTKKVVIGLGFGDEGKGLVTDWLCKDSSVKSLIRYSGGHQVGHCVRTKTEKHVFSNFGSGTIRGIPTFWNARTVDPVGFCREYEDLKKYNPLIKINPLCPVTTPYDKIKNHLLEKSSPHGSVGVGFGTTIQREEDNYHLYFQDLFYPEVFYHKLLAIQSYYDFEITDEEFKDFYESCKRMTGLVSQDLKIEGDIVYESSQGLMLDMDYGFFPHVTRSQVGTQNIDVDKNTEYFLVTRGYQTRHGDGPCSPYLYTPDNPDETNLENEYQGILKERVLDLDLLDYAIKIDPNIRESKNRNLVITCLDQMETYPLVWKGEKQLFKTEKYFIDFIRSKLPPMKKIFASHGFTAEDISLY